MKKIRLGINIDHVATIRNARDENYPDPLKAALIAEKNGADSITIHLREDRRHIRDNDLKIIKKKLRIPLNLEMAAVDEMIQIAINTKPFQVSIVPENRQEITTEGGLNILKQEAHLIEIGNRFRELGILFSLFIDPDIDQVKGAKRVKADSIELNTGPYSEVSNSKERTQHLAQLRDAASNAHDIGLRVFAGHGLTITNISDIIRNVPWVEELNIGHHIVSNSIYVGMEQSVRDMINCIQSQLSKKTTF